MKKLFGILLTILFTFIISGGVLYRYITSKPSIVIYDIYCAISFWVTFIMVSWVISDWVEKVMDLKND